MKTRTPQGKGRYGNTVVDTFPCVGDRPGFDEIDVRLAEHFSMNAQFPLVGEKPANGHATGNGQTAEAVAVTTGDDAPY